MSDVANYTDEQLRNGLKEYGVNPGPVTSSTRLFYEKKLLKLMDTQGNSYPPTESEEEEEEEEEEDEEVQINYRTGPRPNTAPKPAYPSHHAEVPYTPIIQKRKSSPTRAEQPRSAPAGARPKSTAAASSKSSGVGLGMWLKLLFIILVAALIYFVIINMNPSAENKIPMGLDEDEV